MSLIDGEVIDCFKYGIINAHGGDLPRYKGNACQAWALLNGEDRIGLTIHRMEGTGIDCGEILAKSFLEVNEDTRIKEVYEWMESAIPNLFAKTINLIAEKENKIDGACEEHKNALRCYPRRREDGRINWKDKSIHIVRLVNASSEPYGGAYTSLNDKELVIWRAKRIEVEEEYCAIQGQILNITKNGIIVACGFGQVIISEVSYDGVRCNPAEIIKSIRTRLG